MDAATDLPLAWKVETARTNECAVAPALLDALRARGFAPETAVFDKGYDVTPVYEPARHAAFRRLFRFVRRRS